MRIHFIGIGGIGVSALARYYLEKGGEISGSDLVSSEITNALEKRGAKIIIGKHKAKNLPKNADLVIYSPAIQSDNPELQKAIKCKLKIKSYPQALGELTKKYFTIAVCGSHGKSTVAAMIGLLLERAGLDPTVILGTKLKEFGDANCRMGKSKYLVIEADEYKESFLNYWPKIIVLTNLEPDHLDYYRNFKNYILAFKKFIAHLPKDGWLIANKDDKKVYTIFLTIAKNVLFYSLREKEAKKIKEILKVPGEFNVSNALATLKVAWILKIPNKTSFKALSKYKGSWRRFDERNIKLKTKSFKLINDYGHHPTQIKATLKAAREKYPKKKIFCIFQPHQYQRTYYLFEDFVKTFKEVLMRKWVDKLIITDIYDVAGREDKTIKKKVNSQKLIKAVNAQLPKKVHKRETIVCHLCNGEYIADVERVVSFLKKSLRGGEVVIAMGAGNIYNLFNFFKTR